VVQTTPYDTSSCAFTRGRDYPYNISTLINQRKVNGSNLIETLYFVAIVELETLLEK